MRNTLQRIPAGFRAPTFLIVIVFTACTPSFRPTPPVSPTTLPVTPSVASPTSTALPLSPSPLSPTPTPIVTVTSTVGIASIQMTDRMNGWGWGWTDPAGPSRILRTSDGGVTWRDVSPGAGDSYGPLALDAEFAWARSVGNGELWRTDDGGESWKSLGEIEGNKIWFNDPQHGWKMDAEEWGLSYMQFDIQSFSTTQDGGQTWQERTLPPGAGTAFFAFPDSQTAWAIRAWFANTVEGYPNLADSFSLLTTADGGRTWRSQNMPRPPGTDLVDMNDGNSYLAAGNCQFDSPVYSSTTVWIMALACEEGGWLYTSIDQGKTWTIALLPPAQVKDVQFIDPGTGWSLSQDKAHPYQSDLYQTTDGGQTWTLLAHPRWANAELEFLDEQIGWALVRTCDQTDCNPYISPDTLAKTTDGGKTWQILDPLLSSHR